MARPVGTATWVRGRGAPMSWMGSEGLAGGGMPGSFGRLGGIGRSCGARARRPDRHFTTRREGGDTAESAFYKVRKSARGRREQRRRSRAAAASREGRRRNGRGRTRTLPALLRERRGSARGLGAVRGAGARERGPRPIKGSPQRCSRYVPRTSWLSLVLPGAAVSAASHLIRFIHARFCSALSRVGRSSAQDFPPRCFPPAPFFLVP